MANKYNISEASHLNTDSSSQLILLSQKVSSNVYNGNKVPRKVLRHLIHTFDKGTYVIRRRTRTKGKFMIGSRIYYLTAASK